MTQLAPRLPDDDRRTRESGVYLIRIVRREPVVIEPPLGAVVLFVLASLGFAAGLLGLLLR